MEEIIKAKIYPDHEHEDGKWIYGEYTTKENPSKTHRFYEMHHGNFKLQITENGSVCIIGISSDNSDKDRQETEYLMSIANNPYLRPLIDELLGLKLN